MSFGLGTKFVTRRHSHTQSLLVLLNFFENKICQILSKKPTFTFLFPKGTSDSTNV